MDREPLAPTLKGGLTDDPESTLSGCIRFMPDSMYYLANFISLDEEASILSEIAQAPARHRITLSKRSLLTYPSPLSASSSLLSVPLPVWLMKPIVDRLDSLGIFADSPHKQPNHCLINTYKPGQGIMPHEDGEAYHPTVATVSLGASVVLDIWNKDDQSKPRWRVVQEPRSLLITKDRMYYDFLHGIAAVETDEDISPETVANWDMLGDLRGVRDGRLERRTRMSLTYRDVKKVANLGNKFQFAGPRSLRS